MSNVTENETWIDKLIDELIDTKNEVARKVVDADILETLTTLILNNARLDYSGETLRLENETAVFEYLRAIYPNAYAKRLSKLKEEREAEIKRLADQSKPANVKKEA